MSKKKKFNGLVPLSYTRLHAFQTTNREIEYFTAETAVLLVTHMSSSDTVSVHNKPNLNWIFIL